MNGSVFCFNRTAATLKASIYIFLSLCLHLAKLFMTIVCMLIAFAIPHMSGVSQGRSLDRSLVPAVSLVCWALSLCWSYNILQPSWLQIIPNGRVFLSAPRGRRQIWTPSIHPSIHPWPNQPVYIRRHVAHSRRPFLFRKKNKTGEEKKEREQTIRKIVQQQNRVSLLY